MDLRRNAQQRRGSADSGHRSGAITPAVVDPKQTLAVRDSNRQIVWISDISRRRCYSAMIMLGSDNQGLEALWVRAA
jgi:hypothetical protein